jgi:hypothetical protein
VKNSRWFPSMSMMSTPSPAMSGCAQ